MTIPSRFDQMYGKTIPWVLEPQGSSVQMYWLYHINIGNKIHWWNFIKLTKQLIVWAPVSQVSTRLERAVGWIELVLSSIQQKPRGKGLILFYELNNLQPSLSSCSNEIEIKMAAGAWEGEVKQGQGIGAHCSVRRENLKLTGSQIKH